MTHDADFLRAASRLDEPEPAVTGAPQGEVGETPPAMDAPPAAPGEAAIDDGLVWEALSTVIDPEIGLDIVTLGLVYELEPIESAVRITFSLTTPGCPMEEAITGGIVSAVSAVPGVEHVLPNLVWEPRWHPGMIAEGAW